MLTPWNWTDVRLEKLAPVRVTLVPRTPLVGVKLAITGPAPVTATATATAPATATATPPAKRVGKAPAKVKNTSEHRVKESAKRAGRRGKAKTAKEKADAD